jgi:DNA-binding PadR family transcriptional regulator
LEEEGLLSSQAESSGKHTRRRLSLTPAGEQAFAQWVRSPVEHGRDLRIEFLAKIYFAQQESPTAALELVARQRWATRQRLTELNEQADQQHASHSYEWLVLSYRIGQIEAILAWLDTCTDWLIQHETGSVPRSNPSETSSEEYQ